MVARWLNPERRRAALAIVWRRVAGVGADARRGAGPQHHDGVDDEHRAVGPVRAPAAGVHAGDRHRRARRRRRHRAGARHRSARRRRRAVRARQGGRGEVHRRRLGPEAQPTSCTTTSSSSGPQGDPAGVEGQGHRRRARRSSPRSRRPSSRAATRAAPMPPSCATGRRPASMRRRAKVAGYKECGCGMGPALNIASSVRRLRAGRPRHLAQLQEPRRPRRPGRGRQAPLQPVRRHRRQSGEASARQECSSRRRSPTGCSRPRGSRRSPPTRSAASSCSSRTRRDEVGAWPTVGAAAMATLAFAADATAQTADVASVFAAGSLRAALVEAGREFELARPGTSVRFTFGASGLLKERLLAGEAADVFASANMEHPEALSRAGKAGPTQSFARNAMCALVRPGLEVTSGDLVQRMLDPAIKLGTSTPVADPSGDYAWQMFRRIEQDGVADAFNRLSAKALQLTGGPASPPPPPGPGSVYGNWVDTRRRGHLHHLLHERDDRAAREAAAAGRRRARGDQRRRQLRHRSARRRIEGGPGVRRVRARAAGPGDPRRSRLRAALTAGASNGCRRCRAYADAASGRLISRFCGFSFSVCSAFIARPR